MCVYYIDLKRACPKASYPLPNIENLVDSSAGYKIMSFMDAYPDYNQIPRVLVIQRENNLHDWARQLSIQYDALHPEECMSDIPEDDKQCL